MVHLHRAEFEQERTHPMKTQHRLLFLRLHRDRAHPGLMHSSPDRTRIRGIGLVCLHKGPNELRMQQDNLVTHRSDLARPPMPASAGLQRHTSWQSTRQELDEAWA